MKTWIIDLILVLNAGHDFSANFKRLSNVASITHGMIKNNTELRPDIVSQLERYRHCP